MRGSIFKQKNQAPGSWTVVIPLGRDPETGKRKQRWTTVKGSKHDAEKVLRELLTSNDQGTLTKPSKVTVTAYLDRWLSEYAKPNLSPRSFERYRDLVRQHFTSSFGKVALTQLKPEHLQKHYTSCLEAGLNPMTVRYHHAVIHKALDTALKWGLVSRNVADAVEPPPKHRHEMETWDDWEIVRFLKATEDSPYFALFHTVLYTGLRRSEALGLQWQDIDFVFCQLSVRRGLHHLKDGSYVFTEPKSEKSRRTIALSPVALLVFRDHRQRQEQDGLLAGKPLQETNLVFSQPDGKPLRPNTITRAWQSAAKKASVKPIRFHDARHSHASMLLKGGVHPKVVQERLGHSSIEMTLDIYSHVVPGIQEAAARRFDDLINHQVVNETSEQKR
ncbi:MAG: site-specific integrase [Chloroflexi bacterium]|nr:site-specific integrase [Chloroflexota bacterium]